MVYEHTHTQHAHTGIVLSHKEVKKRDPAIYDNNMDEPRGYYAKSNMSKKNTIGFHLHVASKKTKEQTINQKQTHEYREQIGGCQRGRGWVERQNG